MHKFTDKIDEFNQAVYEVKECVRRFDEDLCIKANWTDLVLLRNEF